MKKKPKKEKARLIKVSYIDCINGNVIQIGQLRRDDPTQPILWEYTVFNKEGNTIATNQNTDKHKAFMEAVKIASPEYQKQMLKR